MRHIDTQIMALRQEFITMGLEVLEAVKKTVTAFEEGNEKLAQEVKAESPKQGGSKSKGQEL